ncbi:hypothetical protein ACFL1G_12170 [Planctomycetota bacterium]
MQLKAKFGSLAVVLPALLLLTGVQAQGAIRNEFVERGEFIQIPGPNPILKPGPAGQWNDRIMETADAFKHVGVYYLYYHGAGTNNGYRVGLATATNPLGPFKEYGDKPVLDVGPSGSWESHHVACAMVMEGEDKFYMWYSAAGNDPKYHGWCLGFATAPHPQGPWTKHEGNPIWTGTEGRGGYLGGVVKVEDKFYFYQEYPISDQYPISDDGYKDDYGPMALFTADSSQGPLVPYSGNPILTKGELGEWDNGGISEAEVLYHSGIFHMFYGATKLHGPRLECIGYAYSFDGFNWNKYSMNPIATRYANPNAASFSEVHAIIESPFIYLYHTLRYRDYKGQKFPSLKYENLGIQVLAMQKPFSLDMPVLQRDVLKAGQITQLADCPPISLKQVKQVSLTASCSYAPKARKPIRISVLSSPNGLDFDTADYAVFDNDLKKGQTAQKTYNMQAGINFFKVIVENQDQSEKVSDLVISATLGG